MIPIPQAIQQQYTAEINAAVKAGDTNKVDAIYRSQLHYANRGKAYDTSKMDVDAVKAAKARLPF